MQRILTSLTGRETRKESSGQGAMGAKEEGREERRQISRPPGSPGMRVGGYQGPGPVGLPSAFHTGHSVKPGL